MKNSYRIDGSTVYIQVWERVGKRYLDCLIDLADLPKIKPIDCTWYAYEAITPKGKFYAQGKVPMANGGRINTSLHRILTDAPDEYVVHHIDNDGLNNRRANLEICTQQENLRKRKDPEYWQQFDMMQLQRDNSRAHRYALRRTVESTGMTRQGVWKMLKLNSRSNAREVYNLAYSEAIAIGVENLQSAQKERQAA